MSSILFNLCLKLLLLRIISGLVSLICSFRLKSEIAGGIIWAIQPDFKIEKYDIIKKVEFSYNNETTFPGFVLSWIKFAK